MFWTERRKRRVAAVAAFAVASAIVTVGAFPFYASLATARAAGGADAPATWVAADAAAAGILPSDAVLLGTPSPVEYAYGLDYAGDPGSEAGSAITGSDAPDGIVQILEGDTLSGSVAVWRADDGTTVLPPQATVSADAAVMAGVTVTPRAGVGRVGQARWQLVDAEASVINPDEEPAVLTAGTVDQVVGDGATARVRVLAPAITAILEACSTGSDCDEQAAPGEGGWSVTATTPAGATDTVWRVTVTNTGNVDLSDVKSVTATNDTETVDEALGLSFGEVPAGESRTATFTTPAAQNAAAQTAAVQTPVTLGVSVSGGFSATAPDGSELSDRFQDGAGTSGRVPSGVAEATATPGEAVTDAAGGANVNSAAGEGAGADADELVGALTEPQPPCVGRRCLLRDATSSADLRISISQSSAQATGTYAGYDFSYQVTVANVATVSSAGPADGATVSLSFPAGAFEVAAACDPFSVTGGVVCPVFTLGGTATAPAATATVGMFPTNSQFVVTLTGRYQYANGYATALVTPVVTGTVTAPSGVTDPDLSTNTSQVSTPVGQNCGLTSTITANGSSGNPALWVSPGDVVVGVATITSAGPAWCRTPSSVSQVSSGTAPYLTSYAFQITDCIWNAVATNWTSCPLTLDAHTYSVPSGNISQTRDQGGLNQAVYAPGSSVTLSFTGTMGTWTQECYVSDGGAFKNKTWQVLPVNVSGVTAGARVTLNFSPPPCPQADVWTSYQLAGPISPQTGTVMLTAKFGNNGPSSADGTSILLRIGESLTSYLGEDTTVHLASCSYNTASGWTACPVSVADVTIPGGQGGATLVSAVLESLPAGAELDLAFEVTLGAPAANYRCSALANVSVAYAQIYVPATPWPLRTDPNTSNNTWTLNGTSTPDCPALDPAVTQSVVSINTTLAPDAPVQMAVKFTNNGPESGPVSIRAGYDRNYGFPNVNNMVLSLGDTACAWQDTPTSPVTACPPLTLLVGSQQISTAATASSLFVGSGWVEDFPVGAILTLTYTVSAQWVLPRPATCTGGWSTFLIASTSTDAAHTDTNLNNNLVYLGGSNGGSFGGARCADVAVSKAANPTTVSAGSPLDFVLTVGSTAAVVGVPVSDVLPPQVEFIGVDCAPVASPVGSSCSSSAGSYDPDTRTVTVLVPAIATNGQVLVTIHTLAGNVPPGTFQNTAAVPVQQGGVNGDGASAYYDTVVANNSSTVTFGIENGMSRVVLTKSFDYTDLTPGLPSPAEVDLTFTGSMVCQVQGTFTYTVTVPAGTTGPVTATWSPDRGNVALPAGYWFNGDTCTVTEQAGPQLPVGYQWEGEAEITSPDFTTGTTFTVGDGATSGTADTYVASLSRVEDQLYLDTYIEKLAQDTSDQWVPMEGSQWQVLADNAGSPASPVPGATFTEVPGETGLWHVAGLTVGYYWLVETQTPPGFNLLAQPVGFSVNRVGVITLGANAGTGASATVTTNEATGDQAPYWVMHVKDVPLSQLPVAGGPGDSGVRMAGGLMGGVGVIVLWWVWRRRRPALPKPALPGPDTLPVPDIQ